MFICTHPLFSLCDQISGAKVIVHEPRPGSSDRIVVISGTPDETQAAQSLLHAFILTGPSWQIADHDSLSWMGDYSLSLV